MKKIKSILKTSWTILLLSIAFTSCDDLLTEEPRSFYSSNNFFETVDQANMAVIGVYDPMSAKQLYGQQTSCIFGLDTDIAQVRGAGDDGSRRTIGHYLSHPMVKWLEQSWEKYYQAIDRANYAIVNIQKMDQFTNGTEDEKARLNTYLGEVKFLRAFYYFDLVRYWGDVPMKITPTEAGEDLNLPRTDRELIYDQIIADLESAISLLPWASETAVSERVTQGAARGYLVRVLMGRAGYSLRLNGTMERPGNYEEYLKRAALEADIIIKSGEHALNDSYEQVFRNYGEYVIDPKESIFEVAFFGIGDNAENGGFISTYIGPKTDAKSSYGRANAFVNAMWPFYDSYEDGDLRKEIAVAPYEIKKDDTRKYYTSDKDKQKIFPGKWRREWNAGDPRYINDTDVNWVMLRYSDILLLYAEAINELRDNLPAGLSMSDAFEAVKLVRERAGLDALREGLAQDEFRAAIMQERAWELCFEGWRKWDLIRWNKLGEKLQEAGEAAKEVYSSYVYPASENFQTGKHELFPIPQRDMDINNALTEQNPGY